MDDEPVRVLVTLTGARRAATLPQAPNARVEGFVPHRAVLEHAVASVCDGAIGVVEKSIAAAVPLVTVPSGGKRREIAHRVVTAGAGVNVPVERLTAGRLRAAVLQARSGLAAARAASARLNAGGGPAAFADAAEELLCADPGIAARPPASPRSPAPHPRPLPSSTRHTNQERAL